MNNQPPAIPTPMLSQYWLWSEEQRLSPEFCDLLLKESADIPFESAALGDDGHEDEELRKTNVKFMPPFHWIHGVMLNFALVANAQAQWNLNFSTPNRVQIAQYQGGGHYDWHQDWSPFAPVSLLRRVTVVALLNDPSEFEGGLLQLQSDGHTVTPELKRGSVIAFPSFLSHRVTPVTSGTRYSATGWFSGPRTI